MFLGLYVTDQHKLSHNSLTEGILNIVLSLAPLRCHNHDLE